MQIKAATSYHFEGILRLYMQFNADRIATGMGDANYKYIEGGILWAKSLTDEECTTFVALEKKVVIGFITLRIPKYNPFKNIKTLAEVDLIVVERKLRRRGIGTRLFKAAAKHLKTLGITHIILNVNEENKPAMRFWDKQGFSELSETDYVRTDGKEERTVYMVMET